MVQSIDLATLLAQLPNAQHIHHLVQAHPEIFQSLAGELVRKKTEARQKRIAKAEGTEAGGRTAGGGRATSGGPLGRQEEDASDDPGPLRGRILDTEV